MTGKPIPIRIDDDLLERLDRVTEAMSKRAAGARVPRTSVMRLALQRGLDALEVEMGVGNRRRAKRK